MVVVNVAEFTVVAIQVEVELVEIIIFEYEWEALSKVAATTMDLFGVIQQVLHLILVFQLIVSHVVPLQEILYRFRVGFTNSRLSLIV